MLGYVPSCDVDVGSLVFSYYYGRGGEYYVDVGGKG